LIGFSVELVSNVGAGKVTRSFGVVVLVVVSLLMPVAIVAWVVLRAACERSQRVIRVRRRSPSAVCGVAARAGCGLCAATGTLRRVACLVGCSQAQRAGQAEADGRQACARVSRRLVAGRHIGAVSGRALLEQLKRAKKVRVDEMHMRGQAGIREAALNRLLGVQRSRHQSASGVGFVRPRLRCLLSRAAEQRLPRVRGQLGADDEPGVPEL
jgi:hypothetical protein